MNPDLLQRNPAPVAKCAPVRVRIESIPRLNSGFDRSERNRVRNAILLPFHRHGMNSMATKYFPGRQHTAESISTPLNDRLRPRGSGAQRCNSRDSTRELAAADAHASIVKWDTCRKSW